MNEITFTLFSLFTCISSAQLTKQVP